MFHASPARVWRQITLFEDVPSRPNLFLRLLLPEPVCTRGDKSIPGAFILCIYRGGSLIKRMRRVQPPHLLQFDVVAQRLGIESAVTAVSGSYRLFPRDAGAELVLTTNYIGHLRPRSLFRHSERWLIHLLHRHILRGMCAAFSTPQPFALPHGPRFSGPQP